MLKIPTFYKPLKEYAGKSYWLWVIIDPKYKNDIGLHEHEYLHCKQGWRLPFLHGLLYLLSKKYRLKSEVECYRHQLKFYPGKDPAKLKLRFAQYLAEKYNLDISVKEALGYLQ